MNELRRSHLHKVLKVNPKGVLTLYFFEVWDLELNQEVFDKVKGSPFVLVSSSIDPVSEKFLVADHCPMLKSSPSFVLDPIPAKQPLRISMAALISLTHKGQHLFLVEQGKVKPFGGGLQFTSKPAFTGISFDSEDSLDLRFSICSSQYKDVESWFESKQGRELDPVREIYEEMCLENPILTPEEGRQFVNSLVIKR